MSLRDKLNQFGEWIYQFWDTRVHFLELHYLYILVMIFVVSGLFYIEPGTDWAYIDALFMAVTATTNTGLNTIPMSEVTTYQMIVMYLVCFLGSHVTISFFVVMVRRYYFSKRFEYVLEENKRRKEMYKQQKQREQELEQQKALNDNASISIKATKTIIGPIKRRLSILSIRSNNPRTRKDSHDTRIVYPNFNNDGQNVKGFHSFQPTQEEEEQEDKEAEVGRKETFDRMGTHPFDIESNNNSSCNDLSVTFSSSSYEQQSKQQDEKSMLYIESPTSMKPSLPDNTSNNATTNQQITFREDTNVLRERERRKLLQNRHEDMEHLPLHRTNSEYEIMRQPSSKSDLTREEKYRMGGIEYRALEMLAWIVPAYFIGFIILFGFFFRIYFAASIYGQQVLETSNTNGPVDPWFFSFFMSLSSFTNLGLNHLDASLVPFKTAPAPLLLAIVLILAGNTAFAIFLRFIIWICYVLTPKRSILRRETFRYLLDHPRRCYTTLFPSTQTWWLLIVLVAITLFELICFISLNYWLPVLADISWGARFLDALFQSVATRNAGFSVVSLADINPAAQLVYIVAMYISVYPVAISMRNSNIYQERALGIFRGEDEEPMKFSEDELAEAPFIKLKRHATMTSIAQNTKKLLKGPDFFVITQIQRQLTSDICWVITAVFCICALEAQSIMSPSPVTMATVIYECVSAFGNVGASTGYPNTATSQSAQYRTLSKLVIIILMYRGRHRGLPASIDRSILLPSDELAQKEKEDEERRRNTSASLQLVNDSGTSSGVQHNISDHLIYTRSCTL
ncbi:cation transport protein-domain-containing protein [Gilbertella persicaria]|uniref:Potassium transport protein n=1 Tax=Rhizopus stolonifer TaxID=4846 RepID=A0A367KIZ2_RHIST|nr:cation transport protein-domain-containing protein [Gilbertella persicaria]KAI8090940.1 cation transport protein-domain-containing protein [Gilbertella persicaria]RCI02121.1 hypothetical protein CU098_010345 [Rhizopus stolonifer]